MNKKNVVGCGLIVFGVIAGLFVGGYLCFVGGIIQAIRGFANPEGIQAVSIAIGIARIVFASVAGWITAVVFILPGLRLLN